MCERSGRYKTDVEIKYVQLNTLTIVTAQLFQGAIAQRQAAIRDKEKFRSKSASSLLGLPLPYRPFPAGRPGGLQCSDDVSCFFTDHINVAGNAIASVRPSVFLHSVFGTD